MEMKQVYSIVNSVTTEVLGQENVIKEDLTNIVDIGATVIGTKAIENFTKTLVDHIGKVIFVNRTYSGAAPSVLMDGWEYGSILEKISGSMPEAKENESWELTDGQSYDPNVFYQPKVSAKFFNKRVTFEIDQSFTEMQVKSAFSSASQMNAFLSMLSNEVEKSLTVKTDSLIMRTINNYIGKVQHDASQKSNSINLLKTYNTTYSKSLTAANCIYNPEFLRYAAYVISLYPKRLSRASVLFNEGKKVRFTPKDKLHTIMLDEFVKAAEVYMQSDTFHKELVELPTTETVPFWQGSGKKYDITSTYDLNVDVDISGTATNVRGKILGVMFDRDALGVANLDRRVTTNWNPKAEFFTNFHKFDAGYFNDFDENFIVFHIWDQN